LALRWFCWSWRFSLPAVRAAASDFLGLFRVEKFAPISVSPQQMAMLEQIAEQGLHPGELVMTSEPASRKVASGAEAEALVGFRPRQIPAGGSALRRRRARRQWPADRRSRTAAMR
jgi:hypothetical protein